MTRKRRTSPVTTTTTTTPTPDPPPANVVTLDVPTDGRECTAAIIAAIAKAPDGTLEQPTVAQFPAGAQCGFDATITIDDRRHLVVDLNGATLRATTPGVANRAALRLRQGVNVGVRGGTIHGALPVYPGEVKFVVEQEGQHGVSFDSCAGGWVEQLTIRDVFGDFIEARADDRMSQLAKVPSTGIEVRAGCTFERAGRHGVGLTWVDGFRFLPGSWMHNVGFVMFDLEVNNERGVGRNIDIAGRFGAHRLAFFAHAGLRAWPDCGDVVIHDVTHERTVTTCQPILSLIGKDGARKGGFTIRDCSMLGGGNLVRAIKADQVLAERCLFRRPIGGCGNTYGTRWENSTGTVRDCVFPGAPGAVFLEAGSQVVESGNRLVA